MRLCARRSVGVHTDARNTSSTEFIPSCGGRTGTHTACATRRSGSIVSIVEGTLMKSPAIDTVGGGVGE